MKTSGSWASLLRGVSQQAPEVRQSGQHTEMVNLLPDPVQGLTRRQGTLKMAHLQLANHTGTISTTLAKAMGYRVHTHITEGKEYLFLLNETTDSGYPGYPDAVNPTNYPPAIVCYNKTDKVFVPVNSALFDNQGLVSLIGKKGISALTSVGKYLVYANKETAAGQSTAAKWNNPIHNRLIVWVRGGAYDRTYSIRLSGGIGVSHTTPAPTVANAASLISPQYIAGQLQTTLAGAGLTTSIQGSYIFIDVQQDASVTDGGDNSLIRAVYNVTDDVSRLPILAVDAQVVKVQTGPDTAFYVQAIAKTTTNPSGLNEVRWVECAGETQNGNGVLGLIGIEGGEVKLGGSLAPPFPTIVASLSGDLVSNPPPAFMRNQQVTFLGMFQDRLLVGAGAALAVSAAGDYFNFFRSTVTTVPLKDPFEMIAQGGEDDILRHGVPYSKNLVIFGDKRQYIISGQQALTPLSANISIMTTYPEAGKVPPVAAGGQIYYARDRDGSVALHQIQPGTYVDSAESFPASAQIASYIPSSVRQIEGVPGAPAIMLVRSSSSLNKCYAFWYLDQPDGRKQDAWGTLEFAPSLGALMGVSSYSEGVVLIWLRNTSGTRMDLVADLLPLQAQVGILPYFDSQRSWASVAAGTQEVATSNTLWSVAFKKPSIRFLIGGTFAEAPGLLTQYASESTHLQAGIVNDAYVILTNPYKRDSNGQAITSGRQVVTKLTLNTKDSSGFKSTVTTVNGATDFTYNARPIGSILNVIGIVPVVSALKGVTVGKEIREYTMKIAALKWYPFTLTGIEWVGQTFNRTPRA